MYRQLILFLALGIFARGNPQLLTVPCLDSIDMYGNYTGHIALRSVKLSESESLDFWLFPKILSAPGGVPYSTWEIYPGFSCVYRVDDDRLKLILLSGRTLTLKSFLKADTKIVYRSNGFEAQETAINVIEVRDPSDWKYTYKNGELTSAISPSGTHLIFQSSSGMITAIHQDDRLIFQRTRNSDIIIGDATFRITYDILGRMSRVTRDGIGKIASMEYISGLPSSYFDRQIEVSLTWSPQGTEALRFYPWLNPVYVSKVNKECYDFVTNSNWIILSNDELNTPKVLKLKFDYGKLKTTRYFSKE